MDPPTTTTTQPPQQPPTTTATLTIPTSYIDSTTSSPHSRANDFDETHAPPQQQPTTPKIRLMCSYNGHIIPHPHTKSLIYAGGETRMIAIDRSTTLQELSNRLSKTLIQKPFIIKYQLPNEDLDSLITVSNDEDFDNMIEEYDRILGKSSGRRIRVFLFRVDKIDGSQSMGPILDGGDDWLLNALNCGGVEINRGFSDPNQVNCLLEFDYGGNDFVNANSNYGISSNNNSNSNSNNNISNLGEKVENQSSVPDSTTSSFGSMSSTPTLGNLPQIKVGNGGNEEQFGQMSVGGGGGQVNKVSDEGTVVISSPPCVAVVENRVYLDEERSDNGVNVEFSKQQLVNTKQEMDNSKQLGVELPSPDSISSETSLSAAISRKKPVMNQDSNGQLSSESNRSPSGIPVQQNSETGYPFLPQYNLHQPQTVQQIHPQRMHQQHQILQFQTQPQPQAQQYIPAGAHLVTHPPPGAIPLPAYYPIFPHQQPHPHPYPMYYLPAQSYSLPGQQHPNMGDAPTSIPSNHNPAPPRPAIIPSNAYNPPRNMNMEPPKSEMGVYYVPAQAYGLPAQQNTADASASIPADSTMAPPNSNIINTPAYNPTGNINMDPSKSEMGLVYKTTTGSQSQSQSQSQFQSQQQPQFVGYSQMHHQSQAVAPNVGTIPGYVYEFANPARPEMYYAQPQEPALGTQYQGITSVGPTMMIPESASHVSNDSVKQQIRSSQPL